MVEEEGLGKNRPMKKDRVKKLQKQADALCNRHNALASENSELKKRADVLEDLLKVSPPGHGW